jgi:hypothetical protein
MVFGSLARAWRDYVKEFGDLLQPPHRAPQLRAQPRAAEPAARTNRGSGAQSRRKGSKDRRDLEYPEACGLVIGE